VMGIGMMGWMGITCVLEDEKDKMVDMVDMKKIGHSNARGRTETKTKDGPSNERWAFKIKAHCPGCQVASRVDER